MNRSMLFKCFIVAMLAFHMTGCCSYMVMKNSERKIAYRRAVARGDEAAIKAVAMGDGVAIGLDVTNLDALTEQPLLQIGAALLDALLVYGTYEGVRSLDDDDDDKRDGGNDIQITGDGNDIVIIDGNDNDSNADDEKTEVVE